MQIRTSHVCREVHLICWDGAAAALLNFRNIAKIEKYYYKREAYDCFLFCSHVGCCGCTCELEKISRHSSLAVALLLLETLCRRLKFRFGGLGGRDGLSLGPGDVLAHQAVDHCVVALRLLGRDHLHQRWRALALVLLLLVVVVVLVLVLATPLVAMMAVLGSLVLFHFLLQLLRFLRGFLGFFLRPLLSGPALSGWLVSIRIILSDSLWMRVYMCASVNAMREKNRSQFV